MNSVGRDLVHSISTPGSERTPMARACYEEELLRDGFGR
jgi:hypothetical protein